VVVTRSGGGGGKGRSGGGSGRREAAGGVPERGLEVHPQRLPIVLHHEEVIPTRLHDLFGQIPRAEHGIADDHLPGHRQDAQQLEGGFVFVRLGVGVEGGEGSETEDVWPRVKPRAKARRGP